MHKEKNIIFPVLRQPFNLFCGSFPLFMTTAGDVIHKTDHRARQRSFSLIHACKFSALPKFDFLHEIYII
jgi:hypothetical protein